MKSTIEIHCVGFSMDLDCFHHSSLPEALCCPMNSCSFPVDVVVGCVGVYSYSVPLISLLHCLLVFTNSDLQCSLGLPNVYFRAVLAKNLVDHFLPLLFRHLLFHSHKLLLQCTLGLEVSKISSVFSSGILRWWHCLSICTSRNAIFWSSSFSIVNWMAGRGARFNRLRRLIDCLIAQ